MTDDQVIDIRRFLADASERQVEGAFAVWGGGGERSRFALPIWRAIYLVGGDWGGIVSMSRLGIEDDAQPLFVLDLKTDPARTAVSTRTLQLLRGEDVPALESNEQGDFAVFLGEDDDRRWFLYLSGGGSEATCVGKARETLLFLAGECAGLLFYRELATPLPSSASTP